MSCSCKTGPVDESAIDAAHDSNGCSAGESFALQVLGEDMLPEFNPGDIVVIEPDGALDHGRFVLAQIEGEWLLRQLQRHDDSGRWLLHALNGERQNLPDLPLPDLQVVHGVVIQKAVPGKRKLNKFYV